MSLTGNWGIGRSAVQYSSSSLSLKKVPDGITHHQAIQSGQSQETGITWISGMNLIDNGILHQNLKNVPKVLSTLTYTCHNWNWKPVAQVLGVA